MEAELRKQQLEKADEIARQIWKLSRDKILVSMRFLNVAISNIKFEKRFGLEGVTCDGQKLFYDPVYIIHLYKREPNQVTRLLLHIVMHCIFNHSFRYEKVEQDLWDIAKKYHTTVQELVATNGLKAPRLKLGDKILIVKSVS